MSTEELYVDLLDVELDRIRRLNFEDRRSLNDDELKVATGLSADILKALMKAGQITPVYFGRTRRWPWDQVHRLLGECVAGVRKEVA